MAKQRRTFTAEEKVSILRRHLLDGVAVSDPCDEHGLNPALFCRWQKTFFENGTLAFERRSDARERTVGAKGCQALVTKLARKDEVMGRSLS